ncbi:helix-turn-helix domain-containing protein [Paenibacillus macquariensis]|uniref:helix-turn-helix domain-containing protein n=1 Tax=Paenibacillus macquariensis TaxID=948756 RepID=UPI0007C22C7E|nr:helix-turn-helix transcriptional regulator [Paenibacillus macquariensis]MEC0092518.1 helix-turn-helix transcriptional regulator [Paenibacillus macquariensis]OAB35474.1 transcriptional regulator [Paenibacillus macquariensis subsp. macquariensis]
MRKINIRLKEIIDKRGITQATLSEMSGVRQSAISEMSRNIREQVSLRHLEKIAESLDITDMNELLFIDLGDPEQNDK